MSLFSQWLAVIEAHPGQLHHAAIGASALCVVVMALGLIL